MAALCAISPAGMPASFIFCARGGLGRSDQATKRQQHVVVVVVVIMLTDQNLARDHTRAFIKLWRECVEAGGDMDTYCSLTAFLRPCGLAHSQQILLRERPATALLS